MQERPHRRLGTELETNMATLPSPYFGLYPQLGSPTRIGGRCISYLFFG